MTVFARMLVEGKKLHLPCHPNTNFEPFFKLLIFHHSGATFFFILQLSFNSVFCVCCYNAVLTVWLGLVKKNTW